MALPTPFNFLALSKELRLMISKRLPRIVDHYDSTYCRPELHDLHRRTCPTDILLTCRLIHQEANPIIKNGKSTPRLLLNHDMVDTIPPADLCLQKTAEGHRRFYESQPYVPYFKCYDGPTVDHFDRWLRRCAGGRTLNVMFMMPLEMIKLSYSSLGISRTTGLRESFQRTGTNFGVEVKILISPGTLRFCLGMMKDRLRMMTLSLADARLLLVTGYSSSYRHLVLLRGMSGNGFGGAW